LNLAGVVSCWAGGAHWSSEKFFLSLAEQEDIVNMNSSSVSSSIQIKKPVDLKCFIKSYKRHPGF